MYLGPAGNTSSRLRAPGGGSGGSGGARSGGVRGGQVAAREHVTRVEEAVDDVKPDEQRADRGDLHDGDAYDLHLVTHPHARARGRVLRDAVDASDGLAHGIVDCEAGELRELDADHRHLRGCRKEGCHSAALATATY